MLTPDFLTSGAKDLEALANQTSHAQLTTAIRPQTPEPCQDLVDSLKTKLEDLLLCRACSLREVPFWNAPLSPAEHALRDTYTRYLELGAT